MYNIASISLFILVSAQLLRTLNLILENNLVSFEYFLFDSELNWMYANLKLIVDFYYYFCVNFISFCACFLFLFNFCVKNYDCFMFIFFHLVFFLVKYLILLMFCFIMYWPTDNSDILRLYKYIHQNRYLKLNYSLSDAELMVSKWFRFKIDYLVVQKWMKT